MTPTNLAVVTVVSGRHDHLLRQRRHLRAGARGIRHVVVSMGDGDIGPLLAGDGDVTVVDVPAGAGLPIAAARNAGARAALGGGAQVLVFLDVDCLPAPGLLQAYAAAARERPDALLCGAVTYLPAGALPEPGEDLAPLRNPHGARPDPPAGALVDAERVELFWSLSFAATAATWARVGGFSEDYVGYGGEDTDFAYAARAAGVGMVWVGGADAYHQHHPVSSPPVEHLEAIVANARVFHRRWGVWPMGGWLEAFRERGLVRWTEDSLDLVAGASRSVDDGRDPV